MGKENSRAFSLIDGHDISLGFSHLVFGAWNSRLVGFLYIYRSNYMYLPSL